jgi:imidazolonepropionase-like amidohydrolase
MPYVVHGENAYEIAMLVEAGLSTTEALVAATSGAAAGIAFPEVGLIAPGRFADFVLVDGDPLADVAILQDLDKIALVIKGGQIVADRRA